MRFTKAHGLGNDFVVLDALHDPSILVRDLHGLAKALCDRRYGVGADQVLTVEPPTRQTAAVRMRVFNADGSEAEMCGNGIRCVARLFARRDAGFRSFLVETKAGPHRCEVLHDERVRVDLPAPSFGAHAVGLTSEAHAEPWRDPGQPIALSLLGRRGVLVGVGNPHFVVFVESPADERTVADEGPRIEHHRAFSGDQRAVRLRPVARARDSANVGARRRADLRLRDGRVRDLRRGSPDRPPRRPRHDPPAGGRPRDRARRGRFAPDDRTGDPCLRGRMARGMTVLPPNPSLPRRYRTGRYDPPMRPPTANDTRLTATEQRLCARIAKRRDELIEQLRRLVAIPTGNNHTPGLDEVRGLLCERLAAIGAEVTVVPGDPKPSWLLGGSSGKAPPAAVCAKLTPGLPRILFVGHMDTVFAPDGPFQVMNTSATARPRTAPASSI